MPQSYTPKFKKKIVRLHEEEGRIYKSITQEYWVSKASISKWYSELREEYLLKPRNKERIRFYERKPPVKKGELRKKYHS